MTETICEIIDLDEDEKEIYHIAAHLHDIGKLNDREWIRSVARGCLTFGDIYWAKPSTKQALPASALGVCFKMKTVALGFMYVTDYSYINLFI